MQQANNPAHSLHQTGLLLLFACLALLIVGLQMHHFRDMVYREDEAWVVHGAIERDIDSTIDWLVINTDPPGHTFILKAWVLLTGDKEEAARHFSALMTLLLMAFLYRTVADSAGHTAAFCSVFILGTISFFQFTAHEIRPYPALLCWMMGTYGAYNRWLKSFKRRYLYLFIAFGFLALYTHYFAAYFIAALALYIGLSKKWYRQHYWPLIAAFALLTLLLTAWVLIVQQNNTYLSEGGISYALPPDRWLLNLVYLYAHMQPAPPSVVLFLIFLGLIIPVSRLPGRQHNNRAAFQLRYQALFIPVVILLISLSVNYFIASLTPRNAVIILPFFAILAGIGLASLHRYAIVLIAIMILIPAASHMPEHYRRGPYDVVTTHIDTRYQAGDAIVLESSEPDEHIPVIYYLTERTRSSIQNETITHFTQPNPVHYASMPDPPVNWINEVSDEVRLLNNPPPTVWWIQIYEPLEQAASTRAYLNTHYTLVQRTDIEITNNWNRAPVIIYEYQRRPNTQDSSNQTDTSESN
jgi:hypothetical protein